MVEYATGKGSYVHYRKPTGQTGKIYAWGKSGRTATKKHISGKGWSYTYTTYVTVSGREARKTPAPTPVKPTELWGKKEEVKSKVIKKEVAPPGEEEVYPYYPKESRYGTYKTSHTQKFLPPTYVTPEEFRAKSTYESGKQHFQWLQERGRIDPEQEYRIPVEGQPGVHRIVPGRDFRSEIDAMYGTYLGGQRSSRRETEEWHPETRIIKTDTGYKVDFPYAGAEHYATYKEELKRDWLSESATKLTAGNILGLPSFYEERFGSKQKAIDIKIEELHKIKTDPIGQGIQSPIGHIPYMFLGAFGIGKGLAYVGGRLIARPFVSTVVTKVIPTAVGTALITPTAIDIKHTFERGDTGKAIGKLTVLSMYVGAGYKGFKAGQQSISGLLGRGKGLTSYEMGAWKSYRTGIIKQMNIGKISYRQGIAGIKASKELYGKLTPDIRYMAKHPVYQAEPTLGNIQSFQRTPLLKGWFQRHLSYKWRRSEIFGGAATEKPTTHDLDIAYRSALGVVESKTASTKFGYGDVSQYADIKHLQSVGSIVGKGGAIKFPSYKYPSGMRGMQYGEQFTRLGQSSLELAHSGRAKDIPESVRMLDLIYSRSGTAAKMQGSIAKYKYWVNILQEKPIVLQPSVSAKFYGTSLGEKFWKFKISAYEKLIPTRLKYAAVRRIYGATDRSIPYFAKGRIPPSPTMKILPSPSVGGLFSSGFFMRSLSTQPSTSYKSYFSPSLSLSKVMSSAITSPSTSRIYRSISKSISSSTIPSSTISKSKISKSISSPSISSISKPYSTPFYPSPYYPSISLSGRGRRMWGGDIDIPKYRFREFELPGMQKILKDMFGSTTKRRNVKRKRRKKR